LVQDQVASTRSRPVRGMALLLMEGPQARLIMGTKNTDNTLNYAENRIITRREAINMLATNPEPVMCAWLVDYKGDPVSIPNAVERFDETAFKEVMSRRASYLFPTANAPPSSPASSTATTPAATLVKKRKRAPVAPVEVWFHETFEKVESGTPKYQWIIVKTVWEEYQKYCHHSLVPLKERIERHEFGRFLLRKITKCEAFVKNPHGLCIPYKLKTSYILRS